MLRKELKPISKRKDKLIRINQSDNYTDSIAYVLSPSEYSELIDIKNGFDDAKNETNNILNEKNRVQKEHDIISAENQSLIEQVKKLDDEITTLNAKLSASESHVKNLEAKISEMQDEYTTLKIESSKTEYDTQKELLLDSIVKIDDYKTQLLEIKHLGFIDINIRKKHKDIADALLGKINFQSLKDEYQKELPETKNDDPK